MKPNSHRETHDDDAGRPAAARPREQWPLLELFLGRLRPVVLLLLAIAASGTIGFHLLERVDWLTALYHTVCILTTLGLPIEPRSAAEKVFAIVLALSGIGLFFYAITVVAQFLAEGEFQRKMRRRKVIRTMKSMSQHFIICGYGRIGQIVAGQMRQQGLPLVVVENDEEAFARLEEEGVFGLKGDATIDEILQTAGIERARGLVTVANGDAENILITMTARQLNEEVPIIARCESEANAAKLRRAGATRVVTPYATGAYQLTLAAIKPNVIDWFDLASGKSDHGFEIEEVEVAGNSGVVDRTLRELALSSRLGVMVIGVRPAADRAMHFNPSAETQLAAGDLLICVGKQGSLKQLESLVSAPSR